MGKNEEVFVPPGTMVYLEEEIEDEIDYDASVEELVEFDAISEQDIQKMGITNIKDNNHNCNANNDNDDSDNNHDIEKKSKIEIENKVEKSRKMRTKKTFLYELKEDGDTWIAAYGGEGGIGNGAVKGNTGKSCPPKGGDKRWLTLELRLVADVGLVAVPSAGKSTLLSKISNAKPKIAAYHFTTLVPNLGVCEKYLVSSYDSLSQSKMERSLIVADIPGLIEGAHRGLGLV